ncbi:ExbD/TolR family protein [Sphingomonas sp. URHD0057]|uniref:ExbD/TolR family protein n=1 Tax=Sphingomonas sp. URHD0057 TaxID=1380389 RepID=UPI00048EFB4B|nr:biopolymer transporter ExbD [Sphingomonas sp. URHD0057]
MSMQTTGDNDSGEPMIDMNVTPLIDVMLVLLIMFIITIPIQTHAVKLDLPVQQQNPPPQVIDPIKNVLSINAQDQVLWNGSPVTMPQLRAYLDTTQQMNPVPELHLQPDATARYEIVDKVLAVTKQAHVQKMGFVGNEYYMNIF